MQNEEDEKTFEDIMREIKRDLFCSKQLLKLIQKDIERIKENESKEEVKIIEEPKEEKPVIIKEEKIIIEKVKNTPVKKEIIVEKEIITPEKKLDKTEKIEIKETKVEEEIKEERFKPRRYIFEKKEEKVVPEEDIKTKKIVVEEVKTEPKPEPVVITPQPSYLGSSGRKKRFHHIPETKPEENIQKEEIKEVKKEIIIEEKKVEPPKESFRYGRYYKGAEKTPEKPVEKPIEKVKEKIIEKPKEKIIEKTKETIIEKPKEIIKEKTFERTKIKEAPKVEEKKYKMATTPSHIEVTSSNVKSIRLKYKMKKFQQNKWNIFRYDYY